MNPEDTLKPRQPVYKKVNAVAEFCPICEERLQGNNSAAFPWTCKCGEWEMQYSMGCFERGPVTYHIKVKAL